MKSEDNAKGRGRARIAELRQLAEPTVATKQASKKRTRGRRPKLIFDPVLGLLITKSPPGVKVSSDDVRAALPE